MPEPLSAAAAALSESIDILEKTGILDRVKSKLFNQPDTAAVRLSFVLEQLIKTYTTVDEALVEFNSLSFDDGAAFRDARGSLERLRGGRLRIDMGQARAHCHELLDIYNRYLNGWFHRALNPDEQNELRDLFQSLGDADWTWVDMLGKVAEELKQASERILADLDRQDVAGAREIQQRLTRDFRALQTRLADGLAKIQILRDEFSTITI